MNETHPDRPLPEDLLEEAGREGRGRLKIFLGAAPGVGKTFAMLEEAANRKRQGIDVVAALVETHGRAETAALLEPVEQLPRKRLDYRGQELTELDIDGLIARRPRLALIDELAHTNVPGSRHPKRWQDVMEVLAAGIDVVTTLNVQHIESLNDVVARITGVRVKETVPDEVLRRADDIEIVDLPSEELISRLRQGKVYMPGVVGRALESFFSKGNLTALRELALRTAANRVDADMVAYMRANAVKGPWPAHERLMVCINEAPIAKALVRAGKRLAERAGIDWYVVTVATPRHDALGATARRFTLDAMQLAETLGAETETIQAESGAAAELIAFARRRNVTRLVIGRPRPRWPWRLFREAVSSRLLDAAQDFEVTVIAGDEAARAVPRWRLPTLRLGWTAALAALATTVAATGIASLVDLPSFVSTGSLSVIYLLGILVMGARFGLWPSLLASILSSLAYNFFFTPPLYTFSISTPEDVVSVLLFLLGALFTGSLAGRLRAQVEFMRASQRRTTTLYDFARRIAAATDADDVLYAAAFHIAATLDCRSLILMPDADGVLQQVQGHPAIEDTLDPRAEGAARWAYERKEPAGAGTPTLPTSDWLFVPLATAKPLGVIGVQFRDPRRSLDPETKRLLFAVEDQVAVAVERTRMADDLQALKVKAEGERLRTALLGSLSHDLRTPLVSVIGALSSLEDPEAGIPAAEQRELVGAALDEARRLDRYVQNLLDMTRLEYGALTPRREPVDLREIIGATRTALARVLSGRDIVVEMPRDLPRVDVDPVLIGQAIANVLENAAKYAPAASRITMSARAESNRVILGIEDEGQGIPTAEREKVFDLFHRVATGDRGQTGTGLGLAIVRGFVEAHGGSVTAGEGRSGGALIEIALPAAASEEIGC